MIDWDNRQEWLEQLPHRSQVMFALFCAKQIEPLWKTNITSVNSVAAAERWLEGKATAEECRMFAYSSNSSGAAVYTAAYAANSCAYAATSSYEGAAHAKMGAHYAVDALHIFHSAIVAVNAVESLKQKQVEYLRELYLETLPEEQRNSWLVQACL